MPALSVSNRLAELLAPRCTACRDVLPNDVRTVNFGDLQYHVECQPRCATCRRGLGTGEGGWRSEGYVVSEPWGYGVRPTCFWCPDCLGSAPRDEPKGGF